MSPSSILAPLSSVALRRRLLPAEAGLMNRIEFSRSTPKFVRRSVIRRHVPTVAGSVLEAQSDHLQASVFPVGTLVPVPTLWHFNGAGIGFPQRSCKPEARYVAKGSRVGTTYRPTWAEVWVPVRCAALRTRKRDHPSPNGPPTIAVIAVVSFACQRAGGEGHRKVGTGAESFGG